ncbi:MAG TPA: RNA polymerase sigma factor [Flavobacteriia bacterium]|nr:RNA polymerase sigma factor [Flavobacteriia bacterium]
MEKEKLQKHIEEAKAGNQNAFKILLNTFWKDVYNFLFDKIQNEDEAEDIAIKAFAKAFDKLDTYNKKYTFKTWLITIAKNIYIDNLRKQKTIFVSLNNKDNTNYDIKDETPSAEDILITEQNLAVLLQNIKKLKPNYQEVINLRYFQEMPLKEIALILNEPLSTVKVKLMRSRKLLAEILNKDKQSS